MLEGCDELISTSIVESGSGEGMDPPIRMDGVKLVITGVSPDIVAPVRTTVAGGAVGLSGACCAWKCSPVSSVRPRFEGTERGLAWG